MTSTRNLDLTLLAQCIIEGEMPNTGVEGSDNASLDALVEALEALDAESIEALMEATGGGVAEAHELADQLSDLVMEKAYPQAANTPGAVYILAIDGKPPKRKNARGFSLVREVGIATRNVARREAKGDVVVVGRSGRIRGPRKTGQNIFDTGMPSDRKVNDRLSHLVAMVKKKEKDIAIDAD